jgi:hypothetical protein
VLSLVPTSIGSSGHGGHSIDFYKPFGAPKDKPGNTALARDSHSPRQIVVALSLLFPVVSARRGYDPVLRPREYHP